MPNFLLENGTEELPADFINSAINQWQNKIKQNLSHEFFLKPGKINIYGTPRRLGVLIEGLEDETT